MSRIAITISALLVAGLALTFCSKGAEEVKEQKAEKQIEAQSDFVQPTDSLRWLNYLSFSPQDTALAYIMMGALYLTNKYPEEAIHYFEIASSYDIDRPMIYLNLGYAYNMIGNYEKATESFRLFVQRDPGSILSQEIFRIVEKYRTLSAESDIP
ncbi:MAG TPA: hypothetical protein VJ417_12520 [Candidatus Glassbacteria bacterium]|nr:hypothetical protein [Candidatus Glassbacteria bacterium]